MEPSEIPEDFKLAFESNQTRSDYRVVESGLICSQVQKVQ